MIKTIEELMEAPKKPHLQRLLELIFDGYTVESAKRIVVKEMRNEHPYVKWEDLS